MELQQTYSAGSFNKSSMQHRKKLSGFTLIEILVVIVILGILAAATLFTVDGFSKDILKQEAQRLHGLIRQIEDEAVLQNKELGLDFKQESNTFHYSFYEYDYSNRVWQALEGNIFRTRVLPESVSVSLTVDNKSISIDATEDAIKPDMYFFSNGEKTQFSLLIKNEAQSGNQFTLSSNGFNKTELIQF